MASILRHALYLDLIPELFERPDGALALPLLLFGVQAIIALFLVKGPLAEQVAHVQGVFSQAFDFPKNSPETSALSPENRPKISMGCIQPLNVG